MKKLICITIPILLIASFVLSGKRTNPPIERHAVPWDHEATQATFYRACADCHSHETRWPWYSHFAPVSWKIIDHVEEGREHFNISMQDMGHADEAGEEVEEGEMPIKDYLRMHPSARLTPEETAAFVRGLVATFGSEEEDHSGHDHH